MNKMLSKFELAALADNQRAPIGATKGVSISLQTSQSKFKNAQQHMKSDKIQDGQSVQSSYQTLIKSQSNINHQPPHLGAESAARTIKIGQIDLSLKQSQQIHQEPTKNFIKPAFQTSKSNFIQKQPEKLKNREVRRNEHTKPKHTKIINISPYQTTESINDDIGDEMRDTDEGVNVINDQLPTKQGLSNKGTSQLIRPINENSKQSRGQYGQHGGASSKQGVQSIPSTMNMLSSMNKKNSIPHVEHTTLTQQFFSRINSTNNKMQNYQITSSESANLRTHTAGDEQKIQPQSTNLGPINKTKNMQISGFGAFIKAKNEPNNEKSRMNNNTDQNQDEDVKFGVNNLQISNVLSPKVGPLNPSSQDSPLACSPSPSLVKGITPYNQNLGAKEEPYIASGKTYKTVQRFASSLAIDPSTQLRNLQEEGAENGALSSNNLRSHDGFKRDPDTNQQARYVVGDSVPAIGPRAGIGLMGPKRRGSVSEHIETNPSPSPFNQQHNCKISISRVEDEDYSVQNLPRRPNQLMHPSIQPMANQGPFPFAQTPSASNHPIPTSIFSNNRMGARTAVPAPFNLPPTPLEPPQPMPRPSLFTAESLANTLDGHPQEKPNNWNKTDKDTKNLIDLQNEPCPPSLPSTGKVDTAGQRQRQPQIMKQKKLKIGEGLIEDDENKESFIKIMNVGQHYNDGPNTQGRKNTMKINQLKNETLDNDKLGSESHFEKNGQSFPSIQHDRVMPDDEVLIDDSNIPCDNQSDGEVSSDKDDYIYLKSKQESIIQKNRNCLERKIENYIGRKHINKIDDNYQEEQEQMQTQIQTLQNELSGRSTGQLGNLQNEGQQPHAQNNGNKLVGQVYDAYEDSGRRSYPDGPAATYFGEIQWKHKPKQEGQKDRTPEQLETIPGSSNKKGEEKRKLIIKKERKQQQKSESTPLQTPSPKKQTRQSQVIGSNSYSQSLNRLNLQKKMESTNYGNEISKSNSVYQKGLIDQDQQKQTNTGKSAKSPFLGRKDNSSKAIGTPSKNVQPRKHFISSSAKKKQNEPLYNNEEDLYQLRGSNRKSKKASGMKIGTPKHQATSDSLQKSGSKKYHNNYVTNERGHRFDIVLSHTESHGREARRAATKGSTERAERFKLNSQKSLDIMRALKDSADKTANQIKNVSLARKSTKLNLTLQQAQSKPDGTEDEVEREDQVNTGRKSNTGATARNRSHEHHNFPMNQQSGEQLLNLCNVAGMRAKKQQSDHSRHNLIRQYLTNHNRAREQNVARQSREARKTRKGQSPVQVDQDKEANTINMNNLADKFSIPANATINKQTMSQKIELKNIQKDQNNDNKDGTDQIFKTFAERRKSLENKKQRKCQKDTQVWLNHQMSQIDSIQQQIAQALNSTSEMIKNTKAIDRTLDRSLSKHSKQSGARFGGLQRTQSQAQVEVAQANIGQESCSHPISSLELHNRTSNHDKMGFMMSQNENSKYRSEDKSLASRKAAEDNNEAEDQRMNNQVMLGHPGYQSTSSLLQNDRPGTNPIMNQSQSMTVMKQYQSQPYLGNEAQAKEEQEAGGTSVASQIYDTNNESRQQQQKILGLSVKQQSVRKTNFQDQLKPKNIAHNHSKQRIQQNRSTSTLKPGIDQLGLQKQAHLNSKNQLKNQGTSIHVLQASGVNVGFRNRKYTQYLPNSGQGMNSMVLLKNDSQIGEVNLQMTRQTQSSRELFKKEPSRIKQRPLQQNISEPNIITQVNQDPSDSNTTHKSQVQLPLNYTLDLSNVVKIQNKPATKGVQLQKMKTQAALFKERSNSNIGKGIANMAMQQRLGVQISRVDLAESINIGNCKDRSFMASNLNQSLISKSDKSSNLNTKASQKGQKAYTTKNHKYLNNQVSSNNARRATPSRQASSENSNSFIGAPKNKKSDNGEIIQTNNQQDNIPPPIQLPSNNQSSSFNPGQSTQTMAHN